MDPGFVAWLALYGIDASTLDDNVRNQYMSMYQQQYPNGYTPPAGSGGGAPSPNSNIPATDAYGQMYANNISPVTDVSNLGYQVAPSGGLYGEYDWLANMGQTGSEQGLQDTLQHFIVNPGSPQQVQLYNQLLGYSGAIDPNSALGQQQSAYQKMYASGGYSPEELAAINQAGFDSTRANLATANAEMQRKMRQSGQTAGGYGAIADLASTGQNAFAKQARDTQVLQANEAERRREAGAQGLGQVAGQTAQQQQYGMSGAGNLLNQVNADRMGYASLLQNQQNALRQAQQFGMTGQQNLYNASQAGANTGYAALQNLLSQQPLGYSFNL